MFFILILTFYSWSQRRILHINLVTCNQSEQYSAQIILGTFKAVMSQGYCYMYSSVQSFICSCNYSVFLSFAIEKNGPLILWIRFNFYCILAQWIFINLFYINFFDHLNSLWELELFMLFRQECPEFKTFEM